jgi:phosphopantothenoylcysteine decarboxylase/phosphopantothenate--cysteine ligase
MGRALAQTALRRGCAVRLLLGANAVLPPRFDHLPNLQISRFRSAADLLAQVKDNFTWCDWLIMSAAVADYTPAQTLPAKFHKSSGDWVITLQRTADILRSLANHPLRPQKIICGFSLTDEIDIAAGERKLTAKNLDLLVANGAAALGSEQSTVALLRRNYPPQILPSLSKNRLSGVILRALAAIANI